MQCIRDFKYIPQIKLRKRIFITLLNYKIIKWQSMIKMVIEK